VADDHHLLAAAGDRRFHVLQARSGRQPLIRLGLDLESLRELTSRLSRAKQRAREDGFRARILAP